MRTYTAVVERDPDTGMYVGYIPGWPGAHSQGESLDELQTNLREVVELLAADGEPKLETEIVGTQRLAMCPRPPNAASICRVLSLMTAGGA